MVPMVERGGRGREMTIDEFFSKENRFTFPVVPEADCFSVQQVFDTCIRPVLPAKEILVAWHELLSRYATDPGSVLLTRLYEHQKDTEGRWDNRRCSLTVMDDGFSFAFASNYFARVIYTMAWRGFVPSYEDFKSWIVERRAFLGYFMATDVERKIAAFPLTHYPVRFYTQGWYLAHNVAVNDDQYEEIGDTDIKKDIFTLGKQSDWKEVNGVIVRHLPGSLSSREKMLAVAHFLRFLDPINYFLVPAKKFSQPRTLVGECPDVVNYMRRWAEENYGDTMLRFAKQACLCFSVSVQDDLIRLGACPCSYHFTSRVESVSMVSPLAQPLQEDAGSEVSEDAESDQKREDEKTAEDAAGISDDRLVRMARLYLEQGVSFRNLERIVLGINSKARGGGFIAKKALNDIGITAREKNLLSPMRDNPHEPSRRAIAESTDILHETLVMIYGQ